MPVTLMSPDELFKTDMYRHVAIASGTRHVYIAGQVARDADGNPVAPDDFAGQVAQAYRNVAIALSAAGATFDDVVRLTMYVVDWKPEMATGLDAGMKAVAEDLHISLAPITVIGVAALFAPDLMVEIEATAVVD